MTTPTRREADQSKHLKIMCLLVDRQTNFYKEALKNKKKMNMVGCGPNHSMLAPANTS